MGPLVPEIISSEFSFVIALIIGFGFGFALEQAGFSSTRKLVGLFYGYDFTVLKVFFTAGVTAMTGTLVLSHFGYLDLKLIYVNPTFLWSALTGGLIMGAGFIIGGFCPGTSVCAAAIGKVDGMLFVLGSLIGVLIFTEAYPLLEPLFLSGNFGNVLINESLGLSKLTFGIILVAIAVGAFMVVGFIQKLVTGQNPDYIEFGTMKMRILGALPFIILLTLVIIPDKKESIQNSIAEAKQQKKCVFKAISSDLLVYEMLQTHYKINLIDVRSPEAFKKYHLPLAINIPLDSMMGREWEDIFNQHYKKNVFYAGDDTTAKKACLLAKHIGKSTNFILTESVDEFRRLIFEPEKPEVNASKLAHDKYRFRLKSARELKALAKSLKNSNKPVKKKLKKAKGGCA
ncbi:MAG: YeeE/YedE family protein [Fibrobacteria bacterium]|nr:YeeE/YedE family protein [Fibrobacteria bacterium]